MPKTITTTVYQFPELSDAAKEKARSWMREAGLHDDWWDSIYEDFQEICTILGLELKTREVKLMNGTSRSEPRIWFTGFSCQGDGACFEARLSYAKGMRDAIRVYAPQDETLHGIADRLFAAQKQNFYQLRADISHSGRYYHAYSMSIEVTRDSASWQDPVDGTEEAVITAMQDLANWLYKQLEAEYDYLNSDEEIDERLIANEYTFTQTGQRWMC